ncbi:iron-containing alcohol dehydrogenase family protein [Natronosalvus halobius]|uniref:iron-containing alcohol dehydrogenase family protein n=1 Tax=Natronosalvus halobius TaxID=2953746 RepID=UPI0020A18E9C|nr:iron-containing alcohol dehydrogenase family protein [Natronosalvus halobius]USZ70593.1 iron-containing alcohol dehydrogenase family protein [Natronosalvus halobius]
MARDDQFRFEYEPGVLRFGTGCVDALSDELAQQGFDRALVVCGSTVGSTPEVIDPVKRGLGERLAGVFAETTASKRLSTAVDGLEAMRACDADVLVGLGGGSSLDVASVIAVLDASDREPAEVGQELAETGSISVPDGSLPPIVAVPTTLAGAEQSQVAGVTASPTNGLVDEPASGGVSDRRLMPRAVAYDPALFATTPKPILAASAMNGFDKGLETLYARNATPITDATAMRGLRLLRDGLEALGERSVDENLLQPIAEGIVLVQYGVSRPGETTLSIIHAFGHGLTRTYDVQQGTAHAIVAPRVLRYLFDTVDARRDLLAEALAPDHDGDPADAVVEAVEDVRKALDLPSRLRDVDGPEPEAFPAVAETILEDSFVGNAPPGLEPTAEEIEAVLQDAY